MATTGRMFRCIKIDPVKMHLEYRDQCAYVSAVTGKKCEICDKHKKRRPRSKKGRGVEPAGERRTGEKSGGKE